MPKQESILPCSLHTIGEAADLLGIAIQTIRLYERRGLIIPFRKHSKHRRFTQQDIERLRCIRSMINDDKVSIAGISRILSLIPCWAIKECPADERVNCAAFQQHEMPCWIVSGKSWDCRSANCRECNVYTDVSSCHTIKTTIAEFTTTLRVQK
jgi:MerR family transcriptional regulator, heat shock protein HspR